MRSLACILLFSIALSACKKDKFTTAPQITFQKFQPDQGSNRSSLNTQPYLIFEITDSEGDLDVDTAKIFVKNLLTNKLDSFNFPDLKAARGKQFKGDVQVGLFTVMAGRNLPSSQRPFVDTLSFEVYVTDLARNKSNVIVASPFYYFTLP